MAKSFNITNNRTAAMHRANDNAAADADQIWRDRQFGGVETCQIVDCNNERNSMTHDGIVICSDHQWAMRDYHMKHGKKNDFVSVIMPEWMAANNLSVEVV